MSSRDDDIASINQLMQLGWVMINRPYHSLHSIFGILKDTTSPHVRRAAIVLLNVRTDRLCNQPLPSQRHLASNFRIWTHWRAEFPDDPEVLALIDRVLAGMRLFDVTKASMWTNPFDLVSGDRIETK